MMTKEQKMMITANQVVELKDNGIKVEESTWQSMRVVVAMEDLERASAMKIHKDILICSKF